VSNGWGDGERSGRFATLLGLGGGAVAVAALLLAGTTGAPYLDWDGVNGWVIVFAAGLFAALVSVPFGIEVRLRERYEDRDRRWEISMLAWAAIAVVVLLVAVAAGFDTGTLAGAASLLAAIEAAMVIGTIGAWLLSS